MKLKELSPDQRILAWFSCGAASAVASYTALEQYPNNEVAVVYCDLSLDEDPDNSRFMLDVEKWLGHPITVISSEYSSVEEVWESRKYMAGIKGAPCTTEMKKIPRFEFQRPDDVHIFGYTADEAKRVTRFEESNPDLYLAWPLVDAGFTKGDCFRILSNAGIRLPAAYLAGFNNNNCLGCVKATSPAYWNKVREYRPDIFDRRAKQSRRIGARLVRLHGERIFLDELPEGDYGRYPMPNITCGPECAVPEEK